MPARPRGRGRTVPLLRTWCGPLPPTVDRARIRHYSSRKVVRPTVDVSPPLRRADGSAVAALAAAIAPKQAHRSLLTSPHPHTRKFEARRDAQSRADMLEIIPRSPSMSPLAPLPALLAATRPSTVTIATSGANWHRFLRPLSLLQLVCLTHSCGPPAPPPPPAGAPRASLEQVCLHHHALGSLCRRRRRRRCRGRERSMTTAMRCAAVAERFDPRSAPA